MSPSIKNSSSIYLKLPQILCEIYFVSLSVAQNEIDAQISKLSGIISKGFLFPLELQTVPLFQIAVLFIFNIRVKQNENYYAENKIDTYSLQSLLRY